MTFAALILVLIAAFLHATWNLLAKRSGGGVQFVFLYSLASAVIYLPFAAVAYGSELSGLTATQLAFIALSALVHVGYAVSLQRAYAVGDLSVVYPLARGTGPLLSSLGAILFFGERPTLMALVGGVSVVFGVFLLAGGTKLFRAGASEAGVLGGIITGVFIAGYTLIDATTVSTLAVPPLLVDFGNNLIRSLVLLPFIWRKREELLPLFTAQRRNVLGVAILGPLGYILVLTELKTTPVSYVAPAREISMLLSAVLGATLLQEENFRERIFAALLIAGGVAALALG